jgi:adenylate kinase family enzyme
MNDIKAGKCLSDEAIVDLIEKRTSLYDCLKGWVLDGLPLNKKQC